MEWNLATITRFEIWGSGLGSAWAWNVMFETFRTFQIWVGPFQKTIKIQ